MEEQEAQSTPGKDPDTAGKARHGYRNEVNWEGGSGRQPYSNQGRRETVSPAAGAEVAQGNRGPQSGQTIDQLERVKRKP
jgi:hypothetical protein